MESQFGSNSIIEFEAKAPQKFCQPYYPMALNLFKFDAVQTTGRLFVKMQRHVWKVCGKKALVAEYLLYSIHIKRRTT